MPAGGGGYGDYYALRAIEELLRREGLRFSQQQLIDTYQDLKDKWANNDRGPIVSDGSVNPRFVASLYETMRGGTSGTGTPPPPPPPEDEGLTEAQKRAKRNRIESLTAGFKGYVQAFSIGTSANINKLIDEAARKGYTQSAFLFYLRKTPEYRQRFRGIFTEDGALRMTEDQYLQNERQYHDIASQAGVNLGDGREAWLFRNDVSPSEFADRAPALQTLKSNADAFRQFSKALVQEGVEDAKGVTRKKLFQFVLGMGNAAWTETWNLSRARYAATQAGLNLKRGADRYLALNPRLVERISDKGLSDEAMATGFAEVASNLLTALPLSRIQGYGLTKREIVNASFGGKQSAQTQQKIQRILDQEEAFYEERVGSSEEVSATGSSQRAGYKQRAQGA